MKKIFTLITFLLVTAVAANAQDASEAGRLEAYKIAYITKKLNLSPAEAQKFWPIYNRYQQEIRSARVNNRQNKVNEIEMEEKMLQIRKKYNQQFSSAIDDEKVNKLYRSEREFGLMVQKELMERRLQKNDNRRRQKNK